MAQLPIACTLTSAELQTRKDALLAFFHAHVQEIKDLGNGYSFKFVNQAGLTIELLHLIEMERKCCAFLTFKLIFTEDNGPIWLEISGTGETKQFLDNELNLHLIKSFIKR